VAGTGFSVIYWVSGDMLTRHILYIFDSVTPTGFPMPILSFPATSKLIFPALRGKSEVDIVSSSAGTECLSFTIAADLRQNEAIRDALKKNFHESEITKFLTFTIQKPYARK
jgi:hypothetical protein